jgi:type II secretory ATPase GspE/PulE/Tfp pilus assembly ATPase PilB-like protein
VNFKSGLTFARGLRTILRSAALEVLKESERVLMTIEDPVEYQTPGINQIGSSTGRAAVSD